MGGYYNLSLSKQNWACFTLIGVVVNELSYLCCAVRERGGLKEKERGILSLSSL